MFSLGGLSSEDSTYVFDIAVPKLETNIFAASASNNVIKLYDKSRLKLVFNIALKKILDQAVFLTLWQTTQYQVHKNTIAALVFCPTDPNIILSASHDTTVHLWDLRTASVSQFVFSLLVLL